MKRGERPAKEDLEQLALGVEDIIDEFGWLGFPDRQDIDMRPVHESAPEGIGEGGDPEKDGESREDGEDYDDDSGIEREDIEIGVDQLISRMLRNKPISKDKAGLKPTLWRVFTNFYDESHPILKLVDSFEENIKGYFGIVARDAMKSALADILKIKAIIEKDLGATGG